MLVGRKVFAVIERRVSIGFCALLSLLDMYLRSWSVWMLMKSEERDVVVRCGVDGLVSLHTCMYS